MLTAVHPEILHCSAGKIKESAVKVLLFNQEINVFFSVLNGILVIYFILLETELSLVPRILFS